MAVSLGMTVLDAAKKNGPKPHRLSHIGLLLLIFGAFWEAPQEGIGPARVHSAVFRRHAGGVVRCGEPSGFAVQPAYL